MVKMDAPLHQYEMMRPQNKNQVFHNEPVDTRFTAVRHLSLAMLENTRPATKAHLSETSIMKNVVNTKLEIVRHPWKAVIECVEWKECL